MIGYQKAKANDNNRCENNHHVYNILYLVWSQLHCYEYVNPHFPYAPPEVDKAGPSTPPATCVAWTLHTCQPPPSLLWAAGKVGRPLV